MTYSGEPPPDTPLGAARTRTGQTLRRTAGVFRSVAASARKLGDVERAAELERLATSVGAR
jgi:hypothetical protein